MEILKKKQSILSNTYVFILIQLLFHNQALSFSSLISWHFLSFPLHNTGFQEGAISLLLSIQESLERPRWGGRNLQ